LWAHIQQKDEVDKMRRELVANKGADYYENFNPNDLTLENANKIQEWKPMDIKDVKTNAALRAKEFSTSWMGTDITKPLPGVIQYLDKWGARDEKEAAEYLAQHPGELDASIPEGFDKNDPRVRQAAANAWISNAIGERRPSRDTDYMYMKGLEKTKAEDQMIQTSSGLKVKGTEIPFSIDKVSKRPLLDKQIKDIESQISSEQDPVKKNILVGSLQEATKKKNDVDNLFIMAWQSDVGQEATAAGNKLIKKYLPTVSDSNAIKLNNALSDLHSTYNDSDISPITHPMVEKFKTIGSVVKSLFSTKDGDVKPFELLSSLVRTPATQFNSEAVSLLSQKLGSTATAVQEGLNNTSDASKVMYGVATDVYNTQRSLMDLVKLRLPEKCISF
jgi:hypothetical protein